LIDGWELKKYAKWRNKDTRFLKLILKMMEELDTKIWYLHGNHDDFIDAFIPLKIGNLSIQTDYIYESFGKKYYIVHGDIFDSVNQKIRWLAKMGSMAYNFSMFLNKGLNSLLKIVKIKPVFISKFLKSKVKSMVSSKNSYQKKLINLAKQKSCQAIICGHTHKPCIRDLEDITYMNSGDWVESLSALVEDIEGSWQLVHYKDFVLKNPLKDIELTNKYLDNFTEFYLTTLLKINK
jgi:UDP-2,3-diacylglucosamine pyrophosphatase LpxH